MCVLYDHFAANPPESLRVTDLLFNNVGSHGSNGRSLFEARQKRTRAAAAELGLPLTLIDSNLASFFRTNFQCSHSIRNGAAALLMQSRGGYLLYASTYSLPSCAIKQTHDCAFADQALVPLLSTEMFTSLSVGAQYTRCQKTDRISDWFLAHQFLDVCTNDNFEFNCSACDKCLRTLLTLEILGKLKSFGKVFDLTKYRENRAYYLAKVAGRDGPFEAEIARFAKDVGFRIPSILRTYGALKNWVPNGHRLVPRRLRARLRRSFSE